MASARIRLITADARGIVCIGAPSPVSDVIMYIVYWSYMICQLPQLVHERENEALFCYVQNLGHGKRNALVFAIRQLPQHEQFLALKHLVGLGNLRMLLIHHF